MRHELRAIPPAPRRIRWRPLFAHRWPLLAAGGLLVVVGGLLAWLMFLQAGGKMSDTERLDAGPVTRVRGTLTRVDAPRAWQGRDWQDVRYTFEVPIDGQSITFYGGCFVPAGAWREGEPVEIEALRGDANKNRIVGGALHAERQWLRAKFWITVLATPGALLLLGWLAGVFQLRRVLVHGDVSVGVVHAVRAVPWLLPEMLRVDYTFRDHHAKTRHNHQWVRTHGELGARLLQQQRAGRYEEMPVLHDRAMPWWNRMLLPQDFLPPVAIDLDLPPVDRAP